VRPTSFWALGHWSRSVRAVAGPHRSLILEQWFEAAGAIQERERSKIEFDFVLLVFPRPLHTEDYLLEYHT